MKSQIAGILLAGSLSTASGTELPADTRWVSSPIWITQIQSQQKNRVATTLQKWEVTKAVYVNNESAHEVGDLFLELVAEWKYGNIELEKVAIGNILKSVMKWELSLGKGLDATKKSDIRQAILSLGEQYRSIGTASFNRKVFENMTYDALLRIVVTVNVDSLAQLRVRLTALEKEKKVGLQHAILQSSITSEYASEANLQMYKSLFLAEKIYLESNPELLATCGDKNLKREEYRRIAIILVHRIIATAPQHPHDANHPDHDLFRDRLNQIRKILYPQGEVGYAEAQRWGFEEQTRRNKTLKRQM